MCILEGDVVLPEALEQKTLIFSLLEGNMLFYAMCI